MRVKIGSDQGRALYDKRLSFRGKEKRKPLLSYTLSLFNNSYGTDITRRNIPPIQKFTKIQGTAYLVYDNYFN